MNNLFPRTSITIDEAKAILLGWLDGPVEFRSASPSPSDEETEQLDSLAFSLQDELSEEMDRLESDLAEARYDKRPQGEIQSLRKAVEKHEDLIGQARKYREAIEDELAKGSKSDLLVDSKLSNPMHTYIRRSSFDTWENKLNGDKPKPRRRMLDQEDAILAAIADLGYDPKNLPKPKPDSPGVKADVLKGFMKNPLFSAITSFDNSWDRLRRKQKILD